MPKKPKCPKCGEELPETLLRKAGAAAMGRKAFGKAKARTSEQARAAVNARWAKHKPKAPPKP